MGERVKYSLPHKGNPSWYKNLDSSYMNSVPYYPDIEEYVLEKTGAKLIRSQNGNVYTHLEFESEHDMLWFLLKYS